MPVCLLENTAVFGRLIESRLVYYVMEKRILGPRLETVASFIPIDARVADVGTDHGLLPVWLRLHKIAPFVIASDLRPGPLDAAKRNGERFGIRDISFRLCPGLSGIGQEEVDIVVIAGMSGETIVAILEDADWDWKGKKLILEANTKQPELITWLYAHNLHIEQECIPRENGRLYRVFCVAYGQAVLPRPAFLWGGFISGPYALRQAGLLIKAIAGLAHSADPQDAMRLHEYNEILEDMKDAYHWSDSQLSGEAGTAGDENGF